MSFEHSLQYLTLSIVIGYVSIMDNKQELK